MWDIDYTQTFTLPGQVTLDGTGNGTVRFAPAGENWEIVYNAIAVAPVAPNTAIVDEAVAFTYVGFVGPQYQRDNSGSGSSGDNSDTNYKLQDGTAIYFAWIGGDPGAIATVTITYYKSIPVGRGFRAL